MFAAAHGLETEAAQIGSMRIHPSVGKPHVVRKGCLVDLFETRGLIKDFVAEYWPALQTSSGERRRSTYLDQKALNERLLSGEPPDEDAVETTSGFADGDHAVARVEYPTDVGFIDILTVDDAGNFFVFELKLERGPDRALGQLARYMGWVKVNLAGSRNVGGVVVAKSINEKLRYAVCVMPNITLLEYEVEFRLHDVGAMTGGGTGRAAERAIRWTAARFYARKSGCTFTSLQAKAEAKFWLEPRLELAENHGIPERELTTIVKILERRSDEIKAAWRSHFAR